jgi:hypothetical protein
LLERERSERKEEIAALKCEILGKVDSIFGLVSQTFTAEGIASQNELARGLMTLTRDLEVVEHGLEEERRTRKDEIAILTGTFGETVSGAVRKIEEELAVLQSSKAAKGTDDFIYAAALAQLSEEIASLTARVDSAAWTNTMDQDGQSMKDAAEDADALAVRMAELAAQLGGLAEASQTSLSNLRQEMQKELADLRMASQGCTDHPLFSSFVPWQGHCKAMTDEMADMRQKGTKEFIHKASLAKLSKEIAFLTARLDNNIASQGRTDRPRLPSFLPSQEHNEAMADEMIDGEPQKSDISGDKFIKVQQAQDQLSELNAPISGIPSTCTTF